MLRDDGVVAWLTPVRRRWLYAVSAAVFGLLGVYGIVEAEQLAAWLVVASAVLGVATAHTDRRGGPDVGGDANGLGEASS